MFDQAKRGGDVPSALRDAVEHLSHGVLIFGESGTVLSANREAERIFAYAPGQLVGCTVERLLPEPSKGVSVDQQSRFWIEADGLALGTIQPLDGLRSDGMVVPIEIGVKVLVEGEARYVVASVIDVTERLNLGARLVAVTSARFGVQRLIADVAQRFVNIEPGAVDDAIVDSLRQIGEVLQLDLVVLWQWGAEEPAGIASHFWTHPPLPSAPEPLPLASVPFIASRLQAGEAFWFTRIDEVPDSVDRDRLRRIGLRSAVVVPVAGFPEARGALAFGSTTSEHEWAPAIIEHLRLVSGAFGQALARKASQAALQCALDELHRLRDCAGVQRRPAGTAARTAPKFVWDSPAAKRMIEQIAQVAATPATVLLLGETGVGKEVIA